MTACKLVWGGDQAPAPKLLVAKGTAGKDPAICAATANLVDHKLLVDPKTTGVKFGICYLVKPNGENPAAAKMLVDKYPKVEIDQKGCEFLPFATAVYKDQSILFKSSDPTNHNIHLSPFNNAPLNQMLAAGGEMTLKLVPERRAIPLTCDIHPWMKGYLMVFDHPFFDVTAEDGSFEIKGVPAGAQKLVIWQSAVGFVNPEKGVGMSVTVEPGQATDVGEIKIDPAKVK